MAPPIRRALISVSDKTGIVTLGRFLADRGIEILSTGGSADILRQASVPVVEVSEHTGFPEIMDGRVKTLQPKIHGGLLALRGTASHEEAMRTHGIAPIDLLVVNLYPFEATIARGAADDQCIENIDIGGPALIRAAAKNHGFVTVIVDPEDYAAVVAEMQAGNGATTMELRRRLAAKAYARTGAYDAAIANWFNTALGEPFPQRLVFSGERRQMLRYGENPHQQAAFYASNDPQPGVATAQQIQGKELSFNNLNDTDAALALVCEFIEPAVAIVKHANPCGVGVGASLIEAWGKAFSCDPVSAFGGIVAVNGPLDAATAEAIGAIFIEVVIAPTIDLEARNILASKKNLRVLVTERLPDPGERTMTLRSLCGGYLLQTSDNMIAPDELAVVTKRAPTNAEMADLQFAFRVCKHVKSNAIVFCRDGATVGIGAGQMSRVDSARIAAWKAEDAARSAGDAAPRTKGSVVASDAFFPFPDGLLACADAGATAVIQPGGSVRDPEVIAAADARGMAMIFTGMRHFRH